MKAVALSTALFCTMAFALPAQEALMVGVRSDATGMAHTSEALVDTTFSAFPGPLEENGFEGYITFICDSALVEMQTVFGAELRIEVVPLLAAEVFPALLGGEIDIICGPTTATKKRLSNYISSPPVFLSGVTYAQRKPVSDATACSAMVGSLGGSTSGLALIATIAQSGSFRDDGIILERFRLGDDGWQEAYTDCNDPPAAPIRQYDSHLDLAEAFCSGEIKYYVGDYEIVALTLQAYRKTDPTCDYVISDRMFSEERYVILGNTYRTSPEKIRFIATFFEILNRQIFFQPSILDEAFEDTFPKGQASRKLKTLYWAMRGHIDE